MLCSALLSLLMYNAYAWIYIYDARNRKHLRSISALNPLIWCDSTQKDGFDSAEEHHFWWENKCIFLALLIGICYSSEIRAQKCWLKQFFFILTQYIWISIEIEKRMEKSKLHVTMHHDTQHLSVNWCFTLTKNRRLLQRYNFFPLRLKWRLNWVKKIVIRYWLLWLQKLYKECSNNWQIRIDAKLNSRRFE